MLLVVAKCEIYLAFITCSTMFADPLFSKILDAGNPKGEGSGM
jgi:hypothetical protein